MGALTPAARVKLARVLGLLGSDFGGERDAAGLAAHRIVREAGLSWGEVLAAPSETERLERSANAQRSNTQGGSADLSFCRRHLGHLSTWETEFVYSLASRRKGLSPAQNAKLAQIVAALRARGLY